MESRVPPYKLVMELERAALLEQMEPVHALLRLPGEVTVSAMASVAAQLSAHDKSVREQVDAPLLALPLLEVAQVLALLVVVAVVDKQASEERVPKQVPSGWGPLEEVRNQPADA